MNNRNPSSDSDAATGASTGMLVTIEGIDGSGKSTLTKQLQETVPEWTDSDPVFTREPTDSDIGQLIRDNLAVDERDVFTELYLLMADHSTHLDTTIRPAVADNEIVICDRYIDSRCAYQGYTLDGVLPTPMEFVYQMHDGWSVFPDVTILLDLDAETAVDRITPDREYTEQEKLEETHEKYQEKFETTEKLQQIRENYHELAELDPERFVIVDASQSPDAVYEDVIEVLRDRIAY